MYQNLARQTQTIYSSKALYENNPTVLDPGVLAAISSVLGKAYLLTRSMRLAQTSMTQVPGPLQSSKSGSSSYTNLNEWRNDTEAVIGVVFHDCLTFLARLTILIEYTPEVPWLFSKSFAFWTESESFEET